MTKIESHLLGSATNSSMVEVGFVWGDVGVEFRIDVVWIVTGVEFDIDAVGNKSILRHFVFVTNLSIPTN